MADELKKDEPIGSVDEMPPAFEEAMAKIETENKIQPEVASEPEGEDTSKEQAPVENEEPAEAEQTPEGDTVETNVLENADPDVLDVLRNYYRDDKRIAQELKENPDLLDDVREALDNKRAEQPKVEPKIEPPVDELDVKIAKLDPDVHGAEVVELLKAMAERQKQGSKVLTESQEKLQRQETEAFNTKIDTIFDGHSKDYPLLGNSSQTSRQSAELRSDVFAVANALAMRKTQSTGRRVSVESMIGQAVKLFKNQDGEKAAEQKVIDKLNKQEKTMTNPPTRRQTIKTPKYKDEYDEADAIMEAAEQKAGLTP